MILPRFDASRRDESNGSKIVFLRPLGGEKMQFKVFFKKIWTFSKLSFEN